MAAVPGGNSGRSRRGRSRLGGRGVQSRSVSTTRVKFASGIYAGGGKRGSHIQGSIPISAEGGAILLTISGTPPLEGLFANGDPENPFSWSPEIPSGVIVSAFWKDENNNILMFQRNLGPTNAFNYTELLSFTDFSPFSDAYGITISSGSIVTTVDGNPPAIDNWNNAIEVIP